MGRQVRRVALDFAFPLDQSFADRVYAEHLALCAGDAKGDHDDCAPDWEDSVPKGDGWQLWQTVSDGPVTPVFATPEELIDYMCQPVPVAERTRWSPEAYPSEELKRIAQAFDLFGVRTDLEAVIRRVRALEWALESIAKNTCECEPFAAAFARVTLEEVSE